MPSIPGKILLSSMQAPSSTAVRATTPVVDRQPAHFSVRWHCQQRLVFDSSPRPRCGADIREGIGARTKYVLKNRAVIFCMYPSGTWKAIHLPLGLSRAEGAVFLASDNSLDRAHERQLTRLARFHAMYDTSTSLPSVALGVDGYLDWRHDRATLLQSEHGEIEGTESATARHKYHSFRFRTQSSRPAHTKCDSGEVNCRQGETMRDRAWPSCTLPLPRQPNLTFEEGCCNMWSPLPAPVHSKYSPSNTSREIHLGQSRFPGFRPDERPSDQRLLPCRLIGRTLPRWGYRRLEALVILRPLVVPEASARSRPATASPILPAASRPQTTRT